MLTLQGRLLTDGQTVSVTMMDGKISRIEPVDVTGEVAGDVDSQVASDVRSRAKEDYLAPGLVDLQINGFGGVDFNTLPLTPADVAKAAHGLLSAGVTTFLPTLITNSIENLEELASIIVTARKENPSVAAAIPGIHLEGPFLSPEVGARGAHDPSYIKAPDWSEFSRIQGKAEGLIRIITLSPEWPEAPDFIRRAVASGVHVSIGHTMADHEQIQAAIAAGAAFSTHLGNGAPPVLPRHPNFIWTQLAADELTAGLVADGFHLPPEVLKVFLRAKGDHFYLTSDAVSLSGLPPGRYSTHIGGDVLLTPDGRLCTVEDPRILAGSAQILPYAIAYLVREGVMTLEDAWHYASTKPAELIELPDRGVLKEGAVADLVRFSLDDGKIVIKEVYQQGEMILPTHYPA